MFYGTNPTGFLVEQVWGCPGKLYSLAYPLIRLHLIEQPKYLQVNCFGLITAAEELPMPLMKAHTISKFGFSHCPTRFQIL